MVCDNTFSDCLTVSMFQPAAALVTSKNASYTWYGVVLCPSGSTSFGRIRLAPRGSISSTFLPSSVSVRIATRLSVPMVCVPVVNFITT